MVFVVDDLMATGEEGDDRKANDEWTAARDTSAVETV